MQLSKFSIGVGDRFAHQGEAQLKAIMRAAQAGLDICPVWNKSNREHNFIGTEPTDVRREADAAVKKLGYTGKYFVDADHINFNTVERFIEPSDFFTLDVADFIKKGDKVEVFINENPDKVEEFIASCEKYLGELHIPGMENPINVTKDLLRLIAGKFLAATEHAAELYKYLVSKKGAGNFITEVSMDEVESPQTPVDMLFILKMLADKGVAAQTIAPKFTGRFNKGVDYRGDLKQFEREFEDDVLVIDYAIKEFGLPAELKLSIHSGSDKFSIYPIMAAIIAKYGKGLHLKTAGTTWLEEVIGLAMAGGEALELVKEFYSIANSSKEKRIELCIPYADVIDIDDTKLPSVAEVNSWTGEKFANTLRHIPGHPDYNQDFRQLIHVGFKIAADMGDRYTSLLEKYSDITGKCVEENIYDRHLKRLFDI